MSTCSASPKFSSFSRNLLVYNIAENYLLDYHSCKSKLGRNRADKSVTEGDFLQEQKPCNQDTDIIVTGMKMDGHISQIDVRPYIPVITEGGNIVIKYSYLKLNTAQEQSVTHTCG